MFSLKKNTKHCHVWCFFMVNISEKSSEITICITYSLPGTNSARPWKLIVGSWKTILSFWVQNGYNFRGKLALIVSTGVFCFHKQKVHKNLRLLKQNPVVGFMEAQEQDKQTICEPGSKPPARSEPIMMGLVIQCTGCEFLKKKNKQLAVAGLCWFKIEQQLKIPGKT